MLRSLVDEKKISQDNSSFYQGSGFNLCSVIKRRKEVLRLDQLVTNHIELHTPLEHPDLLETYP